MNPRSLSALWSAVAPALGDHLWQSTLCAVAAGLLTLILRKNCARARYWLWLTSSMKFLLPFSLLVALGSHLPWWWHAPAGAKAGLYVAVEAISQPFTQPAASAMSEVTPTRVPAGLTPLLPVLLSATWLGGVVMVLLLWWRRWRRVSAAVRDSVRLSEGREVEALRRIERVTGVRQRVEMLLSRTTLEPAIFGMVRPVLLWPEGISDQLDNAHLEAILAHELWHVRRRDNLAASIHMIVEAIFWFHPLIWWLGARLVDERERACDEEVVELGGEGRIYAESILRVCEFCVRSPLACLSGVTGSNLKKRMVHIMSVHVVRKLDFSRKLVLSMAGLVAIAAPIGFGLANTTPTLAQSSAEAMSATAPSFESVSIKLSEARTPPSTYAGSRAPMTQMFFSPDGYIASNVPLRAIIQEAYGVQMNQIVGGPDWLSSEKYDIEAKVAKSGAHKPGLDTRAENRKRLETLLAERFHLALHRETKNLLTYALVIDDHGPKLQAAPFDSTSDAMKDPNRRPAAMHQMLMHMDAGSGMAVTALGASLEDLCQHLSQQLGTPVVDKTGLKGSYDFNLRWTSAANPPAKEGETSSASTASPGASAPSLFTAVQEQLGLRLEPQQEPTEILVIDDVTKPVED
ncbi:MAG TPA: M56 family metallopeptidase [Terriglobales bacterium]|nr:M56 family metallopeptidase [Terriglobales bacterium]